MENHGVERVETGVQAPINISFSPLPMHLAYSSPRSIILPRF